MSLKCNHNNMLQKQFVSYTCITYAYMYKYVTPVYCVRKVNWKKGICLDFVTVKRVKKSGFSVRSERWGIICSKTLDTVAKPF